MSINLQKEQLKVTEILCSKYCQTTVENDIIVPDTNPDVLKILQVASEVVITRKSIQQDKVSVQGIIRTNILYIPDGDVIGNVKSITSASDFSHSIDTKDARPGMYLWADAECESPEYTLINSRKLNVRNKIGIGIKIAVPSEIDVATGLSEDSNNIRTKGKPLRICKFCGDAERDIIIRDRLELPPGKPDIGEILKFSAKPSSTELRIIDNKAVVKGELKVCTLYGGNDENSSVQFMEHTLPFTEILETDGFAEGMDGEIDYSVKDLCYEVCTDSDGDKRILAVEITICAYIKASETVELDAIDDAYGTNCSLKLNRNSHNIEQLIENTFAQCPVKERIKVPDYLPELYQICDCNASPNIESVIISDGKVTVSGFVNCNILYISANTETPVAGFSHTLTFSHTFDVPGIDKNSVCDAKSEIEHLSYNICDGHETELRIIVSLWLRAVNSSQVELIDSIEADENSEPGAIPSMVIYFIQDGDTLWDIAKRYKTTPECIIDNNSGTEKEIIKPGNRIYLFRNA